MPRQSNGTYLPPANTAAVSGNTISSTAYNTLETDLGNEITNSLDRAGRSAMQANLPMGSNKITGMADPTTATDAATKNYVDTLTAAFFSTGDMKLTVKVTPDSGWLMCDDGTFGSPSSGSSNSNSSANQALFTLLFNNLADSSAPILTSGGAASTRAAQGSASAAWAANCRMTLPRLLGRALGVAGTGAGIPFKGLAGFTGSESNTLSTSNLPPYTPSGTVTSSINSLTSQARSSSSGGTTINNEIGINTNTGTTILTTFNLNLSGSITSTFTGSAQGGTSAAFSIIQPITYLNVMIKQ